MTTVNGVNAPSLLLTTVKWAVENDLFLSDLVQRYALPHLALVTKGQHLGVGAPNVANPNLKPYVFVHSKRRLRKILAQIVKVKEGKGQILTEHKVAIPETYAGYFEILSEDGRPMKCLESVHELFQQFPELCLVRQSCKAYAPDSDGELRSLYRNRTVCDGEILTLVGQFNFKRISFLRCFDECGRSVYLKMSQKGKFSPVARRRDDDVAGVHTIQNLLCTKRLPLTVKFVHHPNGAPAIPPEIGKILGASNSANQFVVRLLSVFQEDVVFAYSLHKPDGQYLSVPLSAHLKLAPALNHPQVLSHYEFKEISRMCDEVSSTFFDRITIYNDHQLVYDQHYLHVRQENNVTDETEAANGDDFRVSDEENGVDEKIFAQKNKYPTNGNEENIQKITVNNNDQQNMYSVCDDEIDQLYDYIRGLAPMPGTCEQQQPQQYQPRNENANMNSYKPPPPPIETIPSRKSTNSFSSPEPPLPKYHHYQRHKSPPVPTTYNSKSSHGHNYHQNHHQTTTVENRRSPSPIPPEPRTRSPQNPAFVVELRTRCSSSTTTSPCGTNQKTPVPDKRLDDMIYGKNVFNDRLRQLSKSTEKISGNTMEDYHHDRDRAYAGVYRPAHQTPAPVQQQRKPQHHNVPHQYSRRAQSRPRPMSMVIPDNVQLFGPPPHPPQPPPPPPNGHDFFPGTRFNAPSGNLPYHHAYRSFMNLAAIDDEPPAPPPPPPHGLRPQFFPPQFGRPLYQQQRYSPRYHYQSAYRV